MPHEAYIDLYFFLIRLCTCFISVLLHRGSRAAKLRRAIFPRWGALVLLADMLLATRPPWVEAHAVQVTPRQLLVSVASSASFQWPLLWWMHFMESNRKSIALALAMVMLFHRSSLALVVPHLQYTTCAHAALTLFYVWSTLSLRATAATTETTTV